MGASEHNPTVKKRSIHVSLTLLKKLNKIKRFCFYPVLEKTQINKFIPEKAKLPQSCLEVCLLDALDCHCETSTYK